MYMSIRIRRVLGSIALCLCCVMIGSAMTSAMDSTAQAEQQTVVVTSPFTAAIEEVRGSVIGVNNYQMYRQSSGYPYYSDPFGFGFDFGFGGSSGGSKSVEKEMLSSTGSGVVVGNGIVLTNFHVVEDASRLSISVTDDSGKTTEYAASLVTYDENVDVAVLYAPKLTLKPVKLGDSDTLRVGDWAICIGNPLSAELSNTVTVGIVSALNRGIESNSTDKYGRRQTTVNSMIQTDAAINNGNSGGGMFSVTGELMGIPTLKYSGSIYSGATVEGIGMCIPINAAKPLLEDVLNNKVELVPPEEIETDDEQTADNDHDLTGKPRMGITMTGLNPNHSAVRNGDVPNGVYVTEVDKNGPADKAGIQAGDIIVDVDDVIITEPSQLQEIIGQHKAGDVLKIKFYRVPGIENSNQWGDEVPEGEYIDTEVTLEVVDAISQ